MGTDQLQTSCIAGCFLLARTVIAGVCGTITLYAAHEAAESYRMEIKYESTVFGIS